MYWTNIEHLVMYSLPFTDLLTSLSITVKKKAAGILTGAALNLCINSGRIVILTILGLPILK